MLVCKPQRIVTIIFDQIEGFHCYISQKKKHFSPLQELKSKYQDNTTNKKYKHNLLGKSQLASVREVTRIIQKYIYLQVHNKSYNNYKTMEFETRKKLMSSGGQTVLQHDNIYNQYTAIGELIPLQQFIQLSDQIKVEAERRQNLIKSIYAPSYYQKEFKYMRTNLKQRSPYQQLYQTWKQQQQKECTFDSTYKSTLALLDKQKRESQLKKLISENKMTEPIYKYQEENPYFKSKSTMHQKTLKEAFKTQLNFKKQQELKQRYIVQKANQTIYQKSKERVIQTAVNMQLLQRLREITQKQKQQRQKQLKQKQMEKKCFVDFIEKPDLILQKKNDKKQASPQKQQVRKVYIQEIKKDDQGQTKLKRPKKQKSRVYKLNLQEILKIKPKQYLIFYSDNYHQIIRLASPQQMKQLNNYRDQCLKKQESLSRLKQKISQYGPQYIQKLPPSSRQKLFKLLYQQDLELQKKYHL